MDDQRPPQLAGSFISDARTLILALNRRGWQNVWPRITPPIFTSPEPIYDHPTRRLQLRAAPPYD